jgi:hypothetical protein
MLLPVVFLIALASVITATISVGSAVITHGLQTAMYENRLAVVVGEAVQDRLSQTRYPVIFWLGLDNPGSSFSLPKRVKAENLSVFNPGLDFKPETELDPNSLDHAKRIEAYAKLAVVYGTICALSNNSQTSRMRSRLVIAAVLQEFGHPGMAHLYADMNRYF